MDLLTVSPTVLVDTERTGSVDSPFSIDQDCRTVGSTILYRISDP